MALIYFYDATELDRGQLTAGLKGTDHHWEYVADSIEVANCNPDTEVISVFVTSRVTREVIEALPKLRLIACRSTGFDNIDLEAAKERDITVVNVPTYGEATVAEYAFMLLLALTRKLPAVLKSEDEQLSLQQLTGHDLQGLTFGVIGTGHIGLSALKIAAGFSMKTIAFDACERPELQEQYGFTYVPLDELLVRADVISLHVPLLPTTKHLINAESLAKMKPRAILINTARGELVDTKALVEALNEKQLGGAAIDVVEGEALLNIQEEALLLRSDKLPPETLRHSVEISILKKMPNVIISPHNAFNTEEAIDRINQTTANNIVDFWYGNTPNKVNAGKKPVGKLLVARHTESEWNAEGKWTGLTDVHLSGKGFKEAAQLGRALGGLNIPVAIAYCSQQVRSRETLECMLASAQMFDTEVVADKALNERDYGEYTGKNKWEIRDQVGEDAFNDIRRGWDVPVPGGETLKKVYERVVPFYLNTIVPQLQTGKNVLIVAHGNSDRALMKYIESISDEAVCELEMLFGQIMVYDTTPEGHCADSSVVKIDMQPPHA